MAATAPTKPAKNNPTQSFNTAAAVNFSPVQPWEPHHDDKTSLEVQVSPVQPWTPKKEAKKSLSPEEEAALLKKIYENYTVIPYAAEKDKPIVGFNDVMKHLESQRIFKEYMPSFLHNSIDSIFSGGAFSKALSVPRSMGRHSADNLSYGNPVPLALDKVDQLFYKKMEIYSMKRGNDLDHEGSFDAKDVMNKMGEGSLFVQAVYETNDKGQQYVAAHYIYRSTEPDPAKHDLSEQKGFYIGAVEDLRLTKMSPEDLDALYALPEPEAVEPAAEPAVEQEPAGVSLYPDSVQP